MFGDEKIEARKDVSVISWVDALKVYRDIRMVRILLLGAISGFPWVLIASSLSLWLKEEGLK